MDISRESIQKTVLVGVTGCIAVYKACELVRALQKKGEVAVIGALDDTQLAELTAGAVQQIAKAPWKPYIALADTAVLTEEGTADA